MASPFKFDETRARWIGVGCVPVVALMDWFVLRENDFASVRSFLGLLVVSGGFGLIIGFTIDVVRALRTWLTARRHPVEH